MYIAQGFRVVTQSIILYILCAIDQSEQNAALHQVIVQKEDGVHLVPISRYNSGHEFYLALLKIL